MSGYDLPFLNAGLNGSATILLIVGFVAIKAGLVKVHKAAMLAALTVSATFLASYLYYHFAVRGGAHTSYDESVGPVPTRVYAVILLTHTLLAIVAAPMAIVSAWLGITNRIDRHRRLARWALPIWLYVSVTGVVVFWILKDQYPRG